MCVFTGSALTKIIAGLPIPTWVSQASGLGFVNAFSYHIIKPHCSPDFIISQVVRQLENIFYNFVVWLYHAVLIFLCDKEVRYLYV